jgi:hypothetical protein
MGLEDTLNDMLKQLRDTVTFDPAAQGVEEPQTVHIEGTSYDPIGTTQGSSCNGTLPSANAPLEFRGLLLERGKGGD